MTLIYIVSDVRSGSTLLDTLLSQNNSVSSIGEAHHFRNYLLRKKGFDICSCSRNFHDCTFWKVILEELEKDKSFQGDKFVTRFTLGRSPFLRIFQHIGLIYFPNRILSFTRFHKKNKVVAQNRFTLVDKLRVSSPKRILLDSSKNPEAIPYLISQKVYEVKIIHLVRDFRAVAYSKYSRSNGRLSFTKSLISTLIKDWIIRKYIQKVPDGYRISISYEELIRKPDNVMENIEAFLGINSVAIDYKSSIELNEIHNLGGSPHRFNKHFELVEDLRWKRDNEYTDFLSRVNLIKKID